MPKFNAAAIRGIALITALVFSSCNASKPTVTAPTSPPPTRAVVDEAPPATRTPPPTAAVPTLAPTAEPSGTATPTPAQPTPDAAQSAAQASLGGALWAWSSSSYNNGTTVKVREPLRYTLEFTGDGTMKILADCNMASGDYILQENGKLNLTVGAMTKIACPPDTQSVEFLKELSEVESALQQDGALILNFIADSGGMKFTPHIPLSLPEPASGAAAASTRANIPVRLGPDSAYPPYGILRAGAQAEIIGKYTPWWAVRLPGHPDEIGWISQQQVSTSGAENAPSLPPPPSILAAASPCPTSTNPRCWSPTPP